MSAPPPSTDRGELVARVHGVVTAANEDGYLDVVAELSRRASELVRSGQFAM